MLGQTRHSPGDRQGRKDGKHETYQGKAPDARDRQDDAYFAPLARLALRPGTQICLGLVHHTDGIAGTRARLETARRHLPDFLVGTECGFGRRPTETIPELLRIHAEAAAMA